MAPILTPQEPGDEIYQQYAVIRTLPLKTGVNAVKGEFMAIDGNGYLDDLAASGSAVTSATSLAQPMDNVAAVTYSAGTSPPTVQCLVAPSWVIVYAPANIVVGNRVAIVAASGTADPDKVANVAGIDSGIPDGYLGRVHEILGYDATSEDQKLKTADNDKIVVQLGIV